KHSIADGSVGSPHARVGHFQAPNLLERVVISPLLTQRAFLRLQFGQYGQRKKHDSSAADMPLPE
ncbi:hypothetical protein ACROAE_20340, partial [Shewanella sp. MF05960]|uniref:hypothetical protein n=1 Tax=Shewanella sp. MF05960 TaxID=3434874 RepID=UPI003D7BB057